MINRIQFFSPRSTPKEGARPEPLQQYLLSCSDDGTVRLYDFTPLSSKERTASSTPDEVQDLKVRRSSR